MNGTVAWRQLDYWDIVARSLRVTWHNKSLWVFGFLVSLGGGNVLNWSEDFGRPTRDYLTTHLAVLALAVVLLVIIWLVLFVVSIISKGALVAGTHDTDAGSPPTLGQAWARGMRSFWGLLAFVAIGLLAFLVVSLICAIPIVLPLAAGVPGIAIAILIGALLVIPYLAFLFALAFTITYAERAYILEGKGITESLGAGWELMRSCLWKSFVVWLIGFVSDLVFVTALIISLLIMAIPFVLIGLGNVVLGMAIGIPIGVVFVCLATGAYGTYKYALWTIAYGELAGVAAKPPAPDGGAQTSPGNAQDGSTERRSW